MTQNDGVKKLGKNEFYKCPLQHVQSKHMQALFRDFDSHFRIFSDRADHLAVVQVHEDLVWNMRRAASEKGKLGEEDVRRISLEAWLQAVKQHTGKPIQVVVKK
jgi:hypothetical protein